MAQVHVPRSLAALFPGVPRRVEVEGSDVAMLLRQLDRRYPGMWDRLCEPGPRLRPHIKAFVNRQPADLDTPLEDTSVVHIIPAVSGGAEPPVRPTAAHTSSPSVQTRRAPTRAGPPAERAGARPTHETAPSRA